MTAVSKRMCSHCTAAATVKITEDRQRHGESIEEYRERRAWIYVCDLHVSGHPKRVKGETRRI